MKRVKWIFAGIACVGLFATTSMMKRWLDELPSFAGGCGETLVRSVVSPDRHYVAELFHRNCGATTSVASHVNLRPCSEPLRTRGDGTVEEGTIYLENGTGVIRLKWLDPRMLRISASGTQVFRRESRWRLVTLRYSAANRSNE